MSHLHNPYMIEPTPVKFPASLLFPVEIVGILEDVGSSVQRHAPLVRYKYTVEELVGTDDEKTRRNKTEQYGTFESPIEGEISEWLISIGDKVEGPKNAILYVVEPCTHPVQFGGLCAVCGQSLDNKDYTEYDHKERAPISMAHDTTKLTVSYAEAARIEKSLEEQLKSKRKLILVVDLDQTVIQAAVDPTIGEWMKDPSNPNYESIKDVKSFRLEEWIQPNRPGARPEKTVCWYYVKIRPGLATFFAKMKELYEMHVYTMATKAYAMAIAKLIDPDGIYFGDRILSRDDSGSITQKNLQRLFPASTSMVTVIDDRGDVWNWSANLIKVVPYNFFVGIGDINSSLLPEKKGELWETMKKEKKPTDNETNDTNGISAGQTPEKKEQKEEKENEMQQENEKDQDKQDKESNDENNSDDKLVVKETEEQMTVRSASIEAQQHDRPLAKLQANHKAHKVLVDDDKELFKLEKALIAVHAKYYEEYDNNGGQNEPDLKLIIPEMKSKVFKGCTILFSGVIPLGTRLNSADIVQWVRSFGAIVVGDLTDSVTHVVATSKGTTKVRQAVGRKDRHDIHIVYTDWIMACLGSWSRVSEDKYEIHFSEEEKKLIQKEMNNNDYKQKEEEENMGRFMESLKQSDMNWDDMDKELEEFMGTDDNSSSDSEGEAGEEEEKEKQDSNNEKGRKRSVDIEMKEENKKPKFQDNNDDDDSSSIDEDLLQELENDLM